MTNWRWVDEAVVLAIHDEQLAEHGGAPGVRDRGLLQSVLARPQHLAAYEASDLATLAAAYGVGIARNHPFIDGNKRTAFVVVNIFLLDHGYDIAASDVDVVSTINALAGGQLDDPSFADWIRRNLVPTED